MSEHLFDQIAGHLRAVRGIRHAHDVTDLEEHILGTLLPQARSDAERRRVYAHLAAKIRELEVRDGWPPA